MTHQVLVVDDSEEIRDLLGELLSLDGYGVSAAASLAELRQTLDGPPADVVLLDWKLPDGDGIDALPEIKTRWRDSQVIVLTGFGTFDAAVEATKRGAFHFLAKPLQTEVLMSLIRRACEYKQLHDRASKLQEAVALLSAGVSPIFRSPAMKAVLRRAEEVAATVEPLLLTGESGTGKNLLAQLIHTLGPRAAKPFVKIDCSAVPPGMFEQELSGASGQPGLLERASGGTFVVDEIASLKNIDQALLAQLLKTGALRDASAGEAVPITCRVIATTSRIVPEALKSLDLRQDLVQLFGALTIHLPPLRERREDILPLAEAFLQRFAEQAKRTVKGFTTTAAEDLKAFDWPGNVRELENQVQAMVLTAEAEVIDVGDLPFGLRSAVARRRAEYRSGPFRLFHRGSSD